MPVRQGLIPAAGSGSRLGPFTNAIPKELLPVGEKAVIEHVVEAMHLAGIVDIVIVVSPHKHGLSDYLGSGKRFGVDFTYVVQDERLGLANAVAAGEHVVDGTFAVVLGDNFFAPKTFLADLIGYHAVRRPETTVGVARVEDVTRHGIILPDGDRVADMVEKPQPTAAPSDLGALGAYIFETSIFDAIARTPPGTRASTRSPTRSGSRSPWDLMRANEWYLRENGHAEIEHRLPAAYAPPDRAKELE